MPFQQNLGKLGIQAHHPHRRRDAVQGPHRGFRLRRRDSGERRLVDARRRTAKVVFTLGGRRAARARATSPASPIPSSTRSSRRSPTRRRATSSTPPAARSTACCAPATIGCRCGIATPPGSPIGTPSRAPTASPGSASARPAPGGGTRKRRRRSGCEGVAVANGESANGERSIAAMRFRCRIRRSRFADG